MPVVADKFISMSLTDISDRFYDLSLAFSSLNSLIGSLDSLSTDAKANLVAAINEVITKEGSLSGLSTNAKTNLVSAINEIFSNVGSLSSLTTSTKTSLVAAINEMVNHQGSLSSLSTSAKSTLVAAINEVLSNQGELSSLSTSTKTNLVSAINDVLGKLGTVSSLSTSAKTTLVAGVNEVYDFTKVLKESSGAGLHNSLYRGKQIGTSLTAAQSAAIRAGTFNDLWIGDYWTINNVNYLIADFDYFLHTGDSECTTHHVVVVPEKTLYNAQMNTTATTDGGYAGSAMRTTNLDQARTTFTNAFGSDHILTHREFLINGVRDGVSSSIAVYSCTVELMDERMVYGNTEFESAHPDGTVASPYQNKFSMYSSAIKQLNLFRLRPDLISTRQYYWLRNVVSTQFFSNYHAYGNCGCNGAHATDGVRPYALIY